MTAASSGAAEPEANAAPPAAELGYLSTLNAFGIVVYDAPAAIRTGYRVCSALNYANGEDVARDLYMTTSFADLPTLDSATSVGRLRGG